MATDLIYSIEDFDILLLHKKDKIRKAVIASAILIRDEARKLLVSGANSTYKYHTGNISNLEGSILIGKEKGGMIKIHALGTKSDKESYKGRFFVGGTIIRTLTKKRGRSLKKPFSKGFIKPLNTLDTALQNSGKVLQQYIHNAING